MIKKCKHYLLLLIFKENFKRKGQINKNPDLALEWTRHVWFVLHFPLAPISKPTNKSSFPLNQTNYSYFFDDFFNNFKLQRKTESDLHLLEISGEEDSLLTPLPDMDTNPDDFASISNFISPMSQFFYFSSLPFLLLSSFKYKLIPSFQFLWLVHLLYFNSSIPALRVL